jgi:20S proteasome subunit alpha 7
MSSTGSGYDYSPTIYSPDGRIFQVEYAGKAVEKGGTVIGLKCADGVILAVEKLQISKMMIQSSNRRIYSADRHVGIALSGYNTDSRYIAKHAAAECRNYKSTYDAPIPSKVYNDRMSLFVHSHTCYWWLRPFGVSMISAVYDEEEEEAFLHMTDNKGISYRYFGCATGKGKRSATTEIEKLDLPNMTCREGLQAAAKILETVHDDVKEKPFTFECSWICAESGWQHQLVPEDLAAAARAAAVAQIEAEDEDDEDDDDDDDEE